MLVPDAERGGAGRAGGAPRAARHVAGLRRRGTRRRMLRATGDGEPVVHGADVAGVRGASVRRHAAGLRQRPYTRHHDAFQGEPDKLRATSPGRDAGRDQIRAVAHQGEHRTI